MNYSLNVLGYYTSSCLRHKKTFKKPFCKWTKIFWIAFVLQCIVKAEAAEKERVYGLCDKTWSSV